ncbi:hypothetical protein F0562_004512 [Nyssa sinensis]|uniref:Leucine-rich repeat-containing N-terminal plant-type domain-containing protein n=1 Tax=Nyssa sinensis TaxID=561372 RepID=A0A5J5C2Q9_9ASTE|nr:hypothetical protein F0562_004512 [Nyssa sinensis]
MSGNITESIGQLSSLVVLELSENPWEGVITETHLANLSSLKEVSITKSSPNISLVFNISSDWIPPFKLTYINIRSCQLGPKFPTWLRNQNELTTLVLNNARISDTIPDWFWKLELQVNELDVAYNQLSGKVPNSLHFFYLSTVDLSSNRFEGPLPLWSSNVSALYLRDNLFSGPIPRDIGEVMPHLTDLDISMNSLCGSIPLSIGKIPTTNQFNTFDDPSIYKGNPALCGFPLATNCTDNNDKEDFPRRDKEKKDSEDKFEKLWLYISIVMGFFMGFWGVCGTLIIKKSWRDAYFRFIWGMKDKAVLLSLQMLLFLQSKVFGA